MTQYNYPVYPNFKPVQLEDAEFLHKWFKKYPLPINEYTFSTLYCWKVYGSYEWSIWEDFLFVLYTNPKDSTHCSFWSPCGEGDWLKALNIELQYLENCKSSTVPVVRLITEPYISYLNSSDSQYTVEVDDDNSDYIYNTNDLMYLKGRRYAKKRNLIKQFLNFYDADFKPLTPDLLPECLELQKEWCLKKECDEHGVLYYENLAVKEALENFVVLNLKGGVVFADKKIVGFTIGEELTPYMGVVHFEKADTDYKGAYQYLAREFSKYFFKYPYLNREQDMGDESLKQAKQSYFPCFKQTTYVISLKKFNNRINEIGSQI